MRGAGSISELGIEPAELASAQSEIAQQALQTIAQLHAIEAEIKDSPEDERLCCRQERSRPLLDEFKAWLGLPQKTEKKAR